MKRIFTLLASVFLLCSGVTLSAGEKTLWSSESGHSFTNNDHSTGIAIQLSNCDFNFNKFKIQITGSKDDNDPQPVLAVADPDDYNNDEKWHQINSWDRETNEREVTWQNYSSYLDDLKSGKMVLVFLGNEHGKFTKITAEGSSADNLQDSDIKSWILKDGRPGGGSEEPDQPTPDPVDNGFVTLQNGDAHSFQSGWIPKYYVNTPKSLATEKIEGFKVFTAGDIIRVLGNNSGNIQLGFHDGTTDHFDGYITKDEDHYRYLDGGNDYKHIDGFPFDYEVDEVLAKALNDGAQLVIRGEGIEITGVQIQINGEQIEPEPVNPTPTEPEYVEADADGFYQIATADGHTFDSSWAPRYEVEMLKAAQAKIEGFKEFAAGDKVIILGSGNGQIQYGFNDGTTNSYDGWTLRTNEQNDHYRTFGSGDATSGSLPYEFEIDEVLAQALNDGSKLIVRGQGISVTGIKFKHELPRTEKEVWAKSYAPADWEAEPFDLTFSGCNFKAGDQIILGFESYSGGQIQFAYQSEGEDGEETYVKYLFNGNDWTDLNSGSFTFTLNEDFAAALNAGKIFRINGHDFNLTSVSVYTAGAEDVTASDGQLDPNVKTTSRVHTGEFTAINCNRAHGFAFRNANFIAGDIITVHFKPGSLQDDSHIHALYEVYKDNMDPDGYYEGSNTDDGWCQLMNEDGVTNYFPLSSDATSHQFVLTEAMATSLNHYKRFRVYGRRFTMTGLSITTSADPEEVECVFLVHQADENFEINTLTESTDGGAHIFGDDWLPEYIVDTPKSLAEANDKIEDKKFYEGDVLRIRGSVLDYTKQSLIQIGFNDGTQDGRYTGYVAKDDDYYRYMGYQDNGDPKDFFEIDRFPYDFEIDQTMADALNAGAKLVIRGQDIAINAVQLKTPKVRRSYQWVPIFVPNVYPTGLDITGKSVWGYNNDESNDKNDPELTAWIGTARVQEDPNDHSKYVVRMYEEWWDESNLGDDNPDYARKREGAGILGETATHPLRLTYQLIPNYGRLKVGDMLRFTITATDNNEAGFAAKETTEAQLGTFDPEVVFDKNYDINNPVEGYVGITIDVDNGATKPSDYRNFGNSTDTYVIDYVIDAQMLSYITGYGLSINGRNFDVNSVYAKVYTNELDDDEVVGDTHKHNYYFRQNIATPADLENLGLYHRIQIECIDHTYYNEELISTYDANGVFVGSNRVQITGWDDPNNWRDINDVEEEDKPETAQKFSVGLYYWEKTTDAYGKEVYSRTHIHVVDALQERHWQANAGGSTTPVETPEETPASIRAKAPAAAPSVGTVNTVDDGFQLSLARSEASTADADKTGRQMILAITKPELLEAVKENGLQLYGTGYHGTLLGIDNDLTGISEAAADAPIDYNAPYEIYNLQGMRVSTPAPGQIYIVRQDNKVEKVIIR